MRDNAFHTGLGLCPTTPDKDMAAYDALPPMVRAIDADQNSTGGYNGRQD